MKSTMVVLAVLVASSAFVAPRSTFAATYLVRPDATGDFPTIQAAIDAAAAQDTIELADGVFTGIGNRDIHYLGKAITVGSQSGAPEACIVDCENLVGGFSFVAGEGSTSLLTGVTIRNGHATYGGGIYCNNASPTITDCRIEACLTGGGLYCTMDSTPQLTGCVFSHNSNAVYGLSLPFHYTTPSFSNCTFANNAIGIFCDRYCTATVTLCVFRENGKGLLRRSEDFPLLVPANAQLRSLGCPQLSENLQRLPPPVTNCEFIANGSGASCESYASLAFSGCTFSANGTGFTASDHAASSFDHCSFIGNGSGVRCISYCRSSLSDCTFANNGGDGLSFEAASPPTLTRCVIIDNAGVGLSCLDATALLSDCVVAGNWENGLYMSYNNATITGCTLSENGVSSGGAIAFGGLDSHGTYAIVRSVIAYSVQGAAVTCRDPTSSVTLTCCDVYGNDGGDWVGCIEGQQSMNGNIAADPLFCGRINRDFTVRSDSPCAPGGTPTCGLIGALPVGCVPGACCESDETCVVTMQADCRAPGIWQGADSTCDPNPCPEPDDGTIIAWGLNDHGQCNVPAPYEEFIAVAGCWSHSLGLKADGSVVGWGENQQGQCDVPEPNADFVAISGGGWYSVGLKSDGSIVMWGSCASGDCTVPEPNSDFTMISGGWSHTLGLKADSSIVAWGENTHGECAVPESNADFVAVASGGAHSYGLKADSSIVAWGYTGVGACNVPEPNTDFIAVAAGASHGLGLKADGSVVAWGYNIYGALNVPEPNAGFVAVSAGAYHSLGLRADGTIVAWGRNDEGQCNVPEANHGVWVSAGGYHSLALSLTGACCLVAYCLRCTESECDSYGGIFEGTGYLCEPNPCPTSSAEGESQVLSALSLRAAPNPTTGDILIQYDLPMATTATLEIFNAGGALVRRVEEGEQAEGRHSVSWDGRDATGHTLPSGVFLARLTTREGSTTARVVVAK